MEKIITSLDHLLRVDTRPRVDGLTLDVQEVFSEDWGSLVDGFAGAVEHTSCILLFLVHITYFPIFYFFNETLKLNYLFINFS